MCIIQCTVHFLIGRREKKGRWLRTSLLQLPGRSLLPVSSRVCVECFTLRCTHVYMYVMYMCVRQSMAHNIIGLGCKDSNPGFGSRGVPHWHFLGLGSSFCGSFSSFCIPYFPDQRPPPFSSLHRIVASLSSLTSGVLRLPKVIFKYTVTKIGTASV